MFTSKSFKLLLLSIFVLLFFFNKSQAGEPVPGAEILVEQEPNDVPIKAVAHNSTRSNVQRNFSAKCITDKNGEFEISFPKGYKLPSSGTLKLTITTHEVVHPVQSKPGAKDKELNGTEIGGRKYPTTKQKITVKFTTDTVKGEIDAYCTETVGGPYSHAHSNMEDVEKGTKGTTLRFTLILVTPAKSNKGGFAVSGHNMS
ncbi:MAG: hypothetical protein A2X61_05020 [Ignavibacteria bacterium GWB2_35_12]|nr:MAG: hypothetical protein A2X61_05020 [Ignavibacteria bacterium GWB2_35_12]OGU94614.1 MAG: hypothetical protein A2220_04190 [Ignavibacteria bacterium RIFOXYA2_FULL_35_10]OGV23951.1 MAG: hypothetical protein A2475_02810 [Ignavibacteria bacterium RIFOXYC2_FULL_35_21]